MACFSDFTCSSAVHFSIYKTRYLAFCCKKYKKNENLQRFIFYAKFLLDSIGTILHKIFVNFRTTFCLAFEVSVLPNRPPKKYIIRSVESALDLLEAFCDEGEDIGVTRLSERFGLAKSKVFRLLATFEHRGYVEKKIDGCYRLSSSAFEVAQKLLGQFVLLRKARPVMESLAWKCREAVYVGIRKGEEVLLVDMFDTLEQVKVVPLIGNRYPLQNVACGVVLLPGSASAAGEMVTQRSDYAADNGALGEGTSSLAVPLYEARKEICGSLCLVGPSFRFTAERTATELLPLLRDAGEVISMNLGYVPGYVKPAEFHYDTDQSKKARSF